MRKIHFYVITVLYIKRSFKQKEDIFVYISAHMTQLNIYIVVNSFHLTGCVHILHSAVLYDVRVQRTYICSTIVQIVKYLYPVIVCFIWLVRTLFTLCFISMKGR